jgi:DMSO/TMAO reductase YedYZ molybdopterin-dependent catalytic subunit
MRIPAPLLAAVAGMSSVGLALGLTELAAGVFRRVPSLVTSVGSVLIPYTPPAVKDWAIATFGTTDKAVLNAGTVVIVLLVGAVAGIVGRRERSRAAGLYVAFTVLGLLAAWTAPLTSPVLLTVTTLVAVACGWAVLRVSLARLGPAADGASDGPTTTSTDASGRMDRRRVLGWAAGAGVVAVASAWAGRLLRGTSNLDLDTVTLPAPARDLPPPAPATSFEVDGLAPLFVPNDEFYRIDTVLSVPQIDPGDWRLRVTGMVEREVELDYRQLRDLRQIEQDVTIACVSNEVGGGLVGNARWQGVALSDVLEQAGVADGASQIVGRSFDGWTAGFPTEAAFDGRGAMIAIGMNDEPLPARHGFPARLIVPGLYGYVSATKWLTEIELTTWDGFDAYWVPRGWSKRGPIKTQSRIDVPRDGASVPAGETVVAGVAWAPTRGIDRVEVRVDGGSWQECELTEPLSPDAWVQWRTRAQVTAPSQTIEVRATDSTGATQTETTAPPRPDGAQGWHTITVRTS